MAWVLSGCGALAEIGCQSPEPADRRDAESAAGDAIAVEYAASAAAPPGRYEYVGSADTVRYVAATSHGEPIDYERMPWAEFVDMKGRATARDEITATLSHEFGDDVDLAASVSDDAAPFPLVVSLRTETEDGGVVAEPDVSFDAVRSAAPARVTATVSLDGHAETEEYPVGVRKTVRERPRKI